MKIESTREKIKNAIQKAERAVGKNLSLPVLSCIQIEGKENNIIIRSTNLDLGLEIKFPARIHEEGITSVPANTINSFFSNLTDDNNVLLEDINGNLCISNSSVTATVKSFLSEDFPVIPKIMDGKQLSFDVVLFLKGIKSVLFSASTSSIKPELASVCIFSDGNELVFVTTDSFRLAEKHIYGKKNVEFDNVLIPYKNATEIVKIFDDSSGNINITIGKNQISFEMNDIYVTSRLIDGTFPDYKQIIPKEFTTEVVVLKQDLINSLKIANIFSDSFNQVNICIDKNNNKFQIKTRNNDIGENINNISAAITGNDLIINFNYRYIIDCFSSVESDSLSLHFNGLNKPMVIKGITDKSFLCLVMPMNK